MKGKKILGSALAIAGLILAVCTADGSAYELALRFMGVVALGIGAYMERLFDFQKTR